MSKSTEADQLFKRLDVELSENIRTQYFYEPREFRYIISVALFTLFDSYSTQLYIIYLSYNHESFIFRSLIEVLAVLGPKADQIINTSEEDDTDLLEILKVLYHLLNCLRCA